jgi:hypothetical protein
MRDATEIEARIRFLLVEELTARVKLAEHRLPHLCTHNYRHPLDVRKRIAGEVNENYNRIGTSPGTPSMGLCMLGASSVEDWPGTICEEPIDAQRCPYFNPKANKKTIWNDFAQQLKDPDWLRVNMPEVYGLLWAINKMQVPDIPWWKRLWYKLLRIQVEPLSQPEDPEKLLPPWEPVQSKPSLPIVEE